MNFENKLFGPKVRNYTYITFVQNCCEFFRVNGMLKKSTHIFWIFPRYLKELIIFNFSKKLPDIFWNFSMYFKSERIRVLSDSHIVVIQSSLLYLKTSAIMKLFLRKSLCRLLTSALYNELWHATRLGL